MAGSCKTPKPKLDAIIHLCKNNMYLGLDIWLQHSCLAMLKANKKKSSFYLIREKFPPLNMPKTVSQHALCHNVLPDPMTSSSHYFKLLVTLWQLGHPFYSSAKRKLPFIRRVRKKQTEIEYMCLVFWNPFN